MSKCKTSSDSRLAQRYLTIAEVAERFGVGPDTIRRWWEDDKTCLRAWIPSHKLAGQITLRFHADSVEEFARLRQVKQNQKTGR